MRRFVLCVCFVQVLLCATIARGSIFGKIQGIVHDLQHRPIAGASVLLKSTTSAYSQTTQTDDDGQFSFTAVTVGDYTVTVSQQGFDVSKQNITVTSGASPILHFQLQLSSLNQTTTVSAQADTANVDSVTPTTLIGRNDVAQTPGADRSNSLQMITDYVPGAYFTHDQLHIRGGHQVSWLIDGVPIPNTNIASNLGPQIDPKDIDYLEVERGSYDASLGDRTYGEFNVVPRSGFERDNEAELVTTFGNWYQTNDQLNFGGHTQRFAYYASINANRSNLGLQTPIGQVFHDAENGYGAFGTFLYNLDAKDQFRLVMQLRKDYYQIPYDPNPGSSFDSSGLRDGQHESDGFVAFTWVRTINPNMLLTVSPFYHRNTANYRGDPNDTPQAATDDRTSSYLGAQTTFSVTVARNNIQAGVYGFRQNDNEFFNLIDNSPSMNPTITDRENPSGGQIAAFVDDRFNVTSWLTLIAGIRPTHFSGAGQADPMNKQVVEDTINPRFGVAVRIPKINWVFRAFYGHYYQAPPLSSLTGPLLTAIQNGDQLSFSPLHGERDEEHQFGVTIPFRGWSLDADNFQTRANNFFDHNNVGESNIFIPVTIDGALIRGWELTVRSPRIWNRGQFHLAYSNQVANARGAITGGLICFPPGDPSCQVPPGYSPLDHDQRNTLNFGFNATLPWQSFASTNVYYGSGFTNGEFNPPLVTNQYLPQHTTFDLSVGKHFGERFTASVTALNVANRHLLIDNSLTFGGFHYNDPREIYGEFRWRFHY
jgi:TonB dependent receptor/Carboxypeptidase regulatory-like domain/TonB-dependent Receptor Plug Domain